MNEAPTGEPRKVKCPSCGKEFLMARFYRGKAAVACPWCLAPVEIN